MTEEHMGEGAPTEVHATVNGRPVTLPPGSTVADVVASTCPSDRGVAVALQRKVVPRSHWEQVEVREGAAVEVVTAAAGG